MSERLLHGYIFAGRFKVAALDADGDIRILGQCCGVCQIVGKDIIESQPKLVLRVGPEKCITARGENAEVL